jgi:hypothetical protein
MMLGWIALFAILLLTGLLTWAHYRPQDFEGDIAAGVQDLT